MPFRPDRDLQGAAEGRPRRRLGGGRHPRAAGLPPAGPRRDHPGPAEQPARCHRYAVAGGLVGGRQLRRGTLPALHQPHLAGILGLFQMQRNHDRARGDLPQEGVSLKEQNRQAVPSLHQRWSQDIDTCLLKSGPPSARSSC